MPATVIARGDPGKLGEPSAWSKECDRSVATGKEVGVLLLLSRLWGSATAACCCTSLLLVRQGARAGGRCCVTPSPSSPSSLSSLQDAVLTLLEARERVIRDKTAAAAATAVLAQRGSHLLPLLLLSLARRLLLMLSIVSAGATPGAGAVPAGGIDEGGQVLLLLLIPKPSCTAAVGGKGGVAALAGAREVPVEEDLTWQGEAVGAWEQGSRILPCWECDGAGGHGEAVLLTSSASKSMPEALDVRPVLRDVWGAQGPRERVAGAQEVAMSA